MSIDVLFLQEKKQQPNQGVKVAQALADFISAARQSVHIAAYHFALKDPALADPVRQAILDRASSGVEVQIGYFYEHKFNPRDSGGVTNATGTEAFLGDFTSGTRIQLRPIRGTHLMHNKYVVVDGHTPNAAVWTGSTNFTDGAWKDMENNIVRLASPELAAFYENDFNELWTNEDIRGSGSGALDSGFSQIDGDMVSVEFSPGMGTKMDHLIADHISNAAHRIKVSSMVLSSVTVLGALADAAGRNQVAEFSGIYDGPETTGALKNATSGGPQLFASFKDRLVAKNSRKFNPRQPNADYNYMHNKIVVCDNTVITGSFNFSRNATQNAENLLVIDSAEWADKYSAYIDGLVAIYG
jgi:phosphatidylserine/phosphatidylglycerophosphate/cardiolipin synthase-like enzyme